METSLEEVQASNPDLTVRERLLSGLSVFGISDEAAQVMWADPPAIPPDGDNPLYIYLDLNHWISLSKARVGRPDGKPFISCYRLLQKGVASGTLVLPLSETHYEEVGDITDVRQRTALANVMGELTHFRTIAHRSKRLRSEFDAALHARFGRPMFPIKLRPFGTGFEFAFGMADGPSARIVPSGDADEMGEEIDPVELAELEYLSRQVAEYVMLRGPRPEDLDRMPDYEPGYARAVADERARREMVLAELLATEPDRKRRLDDIVHARALRWEVGRDLFELLARAGMSADVFFLKKKEWLSAFLDDIPCVAVGAALALQTFKNGTRPWTVNDIRDNDGLGAAVPYCDVVVTEKHACDALTRRGLPAKYQTRVLRRLADLEELIMLSEVRQV